MFGDLHLLVPVGIKLDAALLHEHTAIMFFPVKGESRKIAFHYKPPGLRVILFLTDIKDAGVQPGSQILF